MIIFAAMSLRCWDNPRDFIRLLLLSLLFFLCLSFSTILGSELKLGRESVQQAVSVDRKQINNDASMNLKNMTD